MDKVNVMYVDSRTYLATQIVNDADILFDTFVYICDRHEASRSLVYSAHCLCLVPRLMHSTLRINTLCPKECNPSIASPRYGIQHLAGHKKSVTGED